MGRAYSTYGVGEVRTVFWWGNLREGDYFENRGADKKNNIKIYLQEVGWGHRLDRSGIG